MPMGEPTTTTSQQHNALALVDNNNNVPSAPGQTPHQFQPSQSFDSLYTGATAPNNPYDPQTPFNLGSTSLWNDLSQQQSPSPPAAFGSEGLPAPPWEAESMDDNKLGSARYPQPQTNDQGMSMYIQQPITTAHLPPSVYPQQQFQGQQIMGMIPQQQIQPGQLHLYPQQLAQQMYSNQMPQPPPYGYGYGYGYAQQQNVQFIDQRMSGLSLNNTTTVYTGPSMANASYVHVPSGKPTKAEDKLFGDLVDFSKEA